MFGLGKLLRHIVLFVVVDVLGHNVVLPLAVGLGPSARDALPRI